MKLEEKVWKCTKIRDKLNWFQINNVITCGLGEKLTWITSEHSFGLDGFSFEDNNSKNIELCLHWTLLSFFLCRGMGLQIQSYCTLSVNQDWANRQIKIIYILGARFLTVGGGSFKYEKGEG